MIQARVARAIVALRGYPNVSGVKPLQGALPKVDYERLVRSVTPETVDALEYVLGALGRNLKAARESAGLTQAQLAKKLGKAQTTVSGSENGKTQVSDKYVAKVLKVCGPPHDWKAARK
jgi:ribosome-binding protein aMBF1 (putative translation factor)